MTEPRPEERRAIRAGQDRYRAGWRKASQQERESDTLVGANLLSQVVPPLAAALSGWVTKAEQGAGKNHSAVDLFLSLPATLRALLVCRSILDGIQKDRSYQQVCIKIGTSLAVESILRKADKSDPRFAQGMRKLLPYWSETHKANRLASYMNQDGGHPLPPLEIRCKAGMVALSLFIETTGLVELRTEQRGKRKTGKVVVPSQRLVSWLSEAHADADLLRPPLPPLYNQPPVPWKDYSGGFPTIETSMVRCKYPQPNPAPLLHRALNLQQETGWQVNERMLGLLDTVWERGSPLAGMPGRELTPFPPTPEVEKDSEEWMQYRRDRYRIHTVRKREEGQRVGTSLLLSLAKDAVGHELFFVHYCDFRGRMYPAASTLSPQGGDLAKCLLEFSEGKAVGAGMPELLAYGASLYGVAGTKQQQIDWTHKHRPHIESCAEYALSEQFWMDAKEPWMFLRWCFEMVEVWKDPSYLSHLPVRIDASNNGFQVWALLLRDAATARATNVLPADAPADLYTEVLVEAEKVLRTRVHALDLEWLRSSCFTRAIVKRPIMVLPYSATTQGMARAIETAVLDAGHADQFEDLGQAAFHLAKTLRTIVTKHCPAIMAGMQWVQDVTRELARAGEVLTWDTATGLQVRNDYRKPRYERVRTYCGRAYKVTKLTYDTPQLDARKCVATAMPNLTHSFDAALAATAVVRAASQGVESFALVHDCFGTHAADLPTLKHALLSCAAELFGGKESPLERLHQSLDIEVPAPPMVRDFNPTMIAESQYFAS